MAKKERNGGYAATPNRDGIILHYIRNGGICSCCGKKIPDDIFPSGMCDAHTHGLKEKGFVELQVVLDFPPEAIAYILDTVAHKVITGEAKEEEGTLIEGIFQDGAIVRLNKHKDEFGDPVYRVVIPDGEFRMPEDSKEYPYNMQMEDIYLQRQTSQH